MNFEEYMEGVRIVRLREKPRHVCSCHNAPHTHHVEHEPCQCRCGRRSQDGGILWYVGEEADSPGCWISKGALLEVPGTRIFIPDIPQAPCARDFGTEKR